MVGFLFLYILSVLPDLTIYVCFNLLFLYRGALESERFSNFPILNFVDPRILRLKKFDGVSRDNGVPCLHICETCWSRRNPVMYSCHTQTLPCHRYQNLVFNPLDLKRLPTWKDIERMTHWGEHVFHSFRNLYSQILITWMPNWTVGGSFVWKKNFKKIEPLNEALKEREWRTSLLFF